MDPFILVKFLKKDGDENKDAKASMVVFEWKDKDLVGIPDPDGFGNVSSYAYFIHTLIISS